LEKKPYTEFTEEEKTIYRWETGIKLFRDVTILSLFLILVAFQGYLEQPQTVISLGGLLLSAGIFGMLWCSFKTESLKKQQESET